jgi:ergothioneine biosynthesis protein EgtB
LKQVACLPLKKKCFINFFFMQDVKQQKEISSLSGAMLSRFQRIRKQTENICRPLQAEDYVVQPIVDVSPPKWHLGHTSWFFEQFVLSVRKENYQLFHPDYAYVFNSYYESVGKRVMRTNRGNLSRPAVEEVYKYRTYINEQMAEYLQEQEVPDEVRYIIELGLQHEQQHQELLVYDIKYILGGNPLFPVYKEHVAAGHKENNLPAAGWLEVPEEVYQVGWDKPGEFHFDNELGVHKEYVHACRLMDRLVTNAEYLEFIKDGGYKDFRHWLQEAWEWVKTDKVEAPFHWHRIDQDWYRFSMHGLERLDMQAPVSHVSFYEADAFARWKGMHLPTEAEWEVACRKYAPSVPAEANMQDSGLFEPQPVQQGNNQLYGDLWEWTSSAYRPYPYYEVADGALGEYNGKFMANQMVLRGGSCATPRDHIRPTYRNFFHPHLQWMYSGIRLAQYM